MEYNKYSARELAYQIRNNKIDPVELIEYRLDKIDAANNKLKALRVVNKTAALEMAKKRQQEAKNGDIRGRLHGLSFCAKDHIDVQGLPQSEGTKTGAIASAPENAFVIQRLLDEGAICIGKANMAQYGKSYETANADFGRTCNPFNLDYSPGGSSGGDAAAVAAEFADFAICADSGGSARIPANFCGLFAIHPTHGLISSSGLSAYTHTTQQLFRSLSPITNTLEDLELLLKVLVHYDQKDPYSLSYPTPNLDKGTQKRKFAWFPSINDVHCHSEISASLNETVEKLESLGFESEEFCPPEFQACYETHIVLGAQVSLTVDDLIAEELGKQREPDSESDDLKNLRNRIATELPALQPKTILKYWHTVDRLRHSIHTVFNKYAFIVCPVTATTPIQHGTKLFKIDSQELQSQHVYQFASTANVLNLPAIAFPTKLTQHTLPLGLQLIGPRFSEQDLVSVIQKLGYLKRLFK